MTAARQERKLPRRRAAAARRIAALAGVALAGLCLLAAPAGAATTELIVADVHTGLAISGFDPVAYFTDSAPVVGHPNLELRLAGATWRFRNEGNRAAFAADPEVYLPRFGGYDPVAAARGAGTAGHPEIWLVSEQKLYLFHNPASRDAFVADPERIIDAADRHWPEVLRTLSP